MKISISTKSLFCRILLVLFLFSGMAYAKSQNPIINSVFVNTESEQIEIHGQYFDNGYVPEVTLAGEVLNLVGPYTDQQIVVELPSKTPGDYLLTVNIRQIKNDGDNSARYLQTSYDLTIGTVGLQGPEGPQGEIGPAGPEGPAGDPAGKSCTTGYVIGFDTSGNLICSNLPATENKYVFVTSTVYNGDLGGVEGADLKCQNRADSANLQGTYKAWISAGDSWPANSFNQSVTPYILVDGSIVADNWDDLVDSSQHSLNRTINKDEFGNTVPSVHYTWTNTFPDGTPATSSSDEFYNCSGFTSSEELEGHSAIRGNANSSSKDPTDLENWTVSGEAECYIAETSLYCFQQ